MRQDEPGDGLHQFLARRLAKQRADGILRRGPAGPEDEQRHKQADPAIHLPLEHMAEHAADEHGRRSDHIITAVLRRGAQGGRADAAAQSAAEQRHPQLHEDRCAQDGEAQGGKRHRLGM